MAPRRFPLVLQRCISVRLSSSSSCSPGSSHGAAARSWWCQGFFQTIPSVGRHDYCSSVVEVQEADLSKTRWHELPPVPRPIQVWTAWEQNKGKRVLDKKASEHEDEKFGNEDGVQRITALRWVSKCCPSLPHSLLQKLFRLRQVRKLTPYSSSSETQQEQLNDSSEIQELGPRLRRVSGKTPVEEGTILYVPKSVFPVFDHHKDVLPHQCSKKTQHQPTAEEVSWLQSIVLYKDSEILVINKPPGLPVQGGTEIKKSLDSLMGAALCFDYVDGPRLVHRLDKETSGTMVLARTQESATVLHAMFRNKTASSTEVDDDMAAIERVYWALVIGTPRKSYGRISVPLMKVVVENGKGDRIMAAHDPSSDNAQVAITDYKVIGPSYHGCSWLELHPFTGRKHQLRVHCAEVLGTPVVGDMKYGWRTQKEWLFQRIIQGSEESETLTSTEAVEDTSEVNSEAAQKTGSIKGSMLSRTPLLHLHCRQMALPNVADMLKRDSSRVDSESGEINFLPFVAPLPPHMAASMKIWSQNSSKSANV